MSWGEKSYRITHPQLGHWVEHDLTLVEPRLSALLLAKPGVGGGSPRVSAASPPFAGFDPLPAEAVTMPARRPPGPIQAGHPIATNSIAFSEEHSDG